MVFGSRAVQEIQRVSAGDFGCFYWIGTYQLCDATQSLSIYSSLFLLMTQALISRILVPGMSNFVNASVSLNWHLLLLDTVLHATLSSVFCDHGPSDNRERYCFLQMNPANCAQL